MCKSTNGQFLLGIKFHDQISRFQTLFFVFSEEPEPYDPGDIQMVRVYPFCNVQSQAWTHAVLVIGLYELLGKREVIRIHKSKKYRQHNDQKKQDKKTNNDLQNKQNHST
jgi:hypothetical protein